MKLSNDDILNYVDGTLSPERLSRVEAHLRENAEDAALVQDMKEARVALLDWHEAEPVRVSDDFWIKVRQGLPEGGPRRSWSTKVREWLLPTQSPLGLSARVGAVAIVLVLGALFFAPEQGQQVAIADPKPSPADIAFVQQASKQHKAFADTPDTALSTLAAGDASAQESGDDEDDEGFSP